MNGNRVVNRQFQAASKVFHKGNKQLTLQGMIHWGTYEYFRLMQQRIDACNGIILQEDTRYLDPTYLIQLSEADFYTFCRFVKKKTKKVLEMMSAVLGLYYQWDVLKYPGPPRAICADVSWRESQAFNIYVESTTSEIPAENNAKEATWDFLIASGSSARVLVNELFYRCVKMLGEQNARQASGHLLELFHQWNKQHRFHNPQKAAEVFWDLLDYFGSKDNDLEPEQKAFWLDKREARVLTLVGKIEKLNHVDEILVMYGSGHFDALQCGVEARGWKFVGPTAWTTACTFPPCSDAEMMKTLDAITAI